MLRKILFFIFGYFLIAGQAQEIRTIQLKPVGSSEQLSIIPLGSTLELSFDDLNADNKEYQYKIEHMTYNWKVSNLIPSQYVNGFEQNYITEVTNSFNTLQDYTHYSIKIPNQSSKITKTGNYKISVIDENDNVIFTRRCTFYKNKTLVGISVTPTRIMQSLNKEQNVKIVVNYKDFKINNPQQEIKVAILQNSNWKTVRYNESPQFFKPQQLIYSYVNENNFLGGNEFRHFDNKSIRSTSLNIAKTEIKDIHHNYLYTDEPRRNFQYNYNPDANGQFIIRTLDSNDPNTEADYAMIHFSLNDTIFKDADIYIVGKFNNYELTEENRLIYNDKKLSNCTIKLKQGYYDYQYVALTEDGVDISRTDGTFYETENEYTVLVYYQPLGSQYDKVIGVGRGFIKN